ncbi:MAG TPA: hypothetical protein VHD36_07415 [Pirellulales bacterium]|nr:hypothetical protein [Pirellulales bacterium]
MSENSRHGSNHASNPWPLVLCLVGVDYFSTLAYLPSMAVQAAGPWAPIAAAGVVLITFVLALPVYWYIVGRAPDGRGATGVLEDLIPGWRGKIVVLTLLGFAAGDFVITRSLSVADATVHLLNNPHGQRLLARLPAGLRIDDHIWWPPLERLLVRLIQPQVAITLGLSIVSFAAWQLLKHGLTRRILLVTAAAVVGYMLLISVVIGSALAEVARHPDIWQNWTAEIFEVVPQDFVAGEGASFTWLWPWLSMLLWTFPQMALGLSGFEMILSVVPQVSGGVGTEEERIARRVRHTRKLMLIAASIMAVYLVSAVAVTTWFVPFSQLEHGGAAENRALAYIAHGSPLATGAALNPMFDHRFGDLFDLSTAIILCLAGATVTMGLQNMLPHYLNRLGMEVSWAGRLGVILLVLNAIVLLVTVVFRASPSSQQWAYATSVLVLLAGAALAAAKDLGMRDWTRSARLPLLALFALAGGFFLVMTGLTVAINQSGLAIALSFVVGILGSSIISRWIRSTEPRFEGFEFADEETRGRWNQLCRSGPKVLAPHRPGLISLTQKSLELHRDYRLDPAIPIIFVEVFLGDPSNFYQSPLMKIEREEGLEVIRVSRCVSVAHVLASICLELCRDDGEPPEIIFGWSNEPPLAANLNFLLLGEGNVPWMVRELVRKAKPAEERQPRILIG